MTLLSLSLTTFLARRTAGMEVGPGEGGVCGGDVPFGLVLGINFFCLFV